MLKSSGKSAISLRARTKITESRGKALVAIRACKANAEIQPVELLRALSEM